MRRAHLLYKYFLEVIIELKYICLIKFESYYLDECYKITTSHAKYSYRVILYLSLHTRVRYMREVKKERRENKALRKLYKIEG